MSSTIENRESPAVHWPPPAAATVADPAPNAPEPARSRRWQRRGFRLIALAVLVGLLLLGGGFGIGYAVGSAAASSSVVGFDPSRRGEIPDGGSPGGGPGSSFGDQGTDGTGSGGTYESSGSTTS